MTHKAGFVNILGHPNVGKSTLMNALVGERISIITSKAQTTRHRILGIVNGDDFQIVYSDTPGIVKPRYKLHEGMMRSVDEAMGDADLFLFVVDVTSDEEPDEKTLRRLGNAAGPVLVLLNKIDKGKPDQIAAKEKYWKGQLPNAQRLQVSALTKKNIDVLLEKIIAALPVHEAFYPKDALTDRPERFFVSEIIREKVLLFYQQEIPYSVEVITEAFKEEETIIRISAVIVAARESQKAILIGHQGSMLKKTGTAARKDLEEFLGKKVFLQLFVKVDKDWRDSESRLKRYGYL